MRKLITLTALALGLSTGGVAMADRWHGGGHGGGNVVRDHRGGGGGVVVRENHGGSWGRHDGGRVVVREHNNWGGHRGEWHGGTYYRSGWRRPIYVNRPIIRERYYNYYQRPAVIVENYNAMDGYYWVAGQWQWDGYQWCWQPGHYEADPNYYIE